MSETEGRASGAQSVHRAAAVLRALARRNQVGIRMTDLAKELGLEHPTVHRLLKALVAEGLAQQDPTTRRYGLGSFVYELGLAAEPRFPLKDLVAPSLRFLAAETGDTAFSAVRAGNDALCIDRQAGSFPVKAFTIEVGGRIPLGVGCGGLAMLAALPPDEADAVMAFNAPRLSEFTDTTSDELAALVSDARRRGYAFNPRRAAGVIALGMALRDADGGIAGSVSIAAIEKRFTPERVEPVLRLVQGEVRKIEKALASRAALAGAAVDRAP